MVQRGPQFAFVANRPLWESTSECRPTLSSNHRFFHTAQASEERFEHVGLGSGSMREELVKIWSAGFGSAPTRDSDARTLRTVARGTPAYPNPALFYRSH